MNKRRKLLECMSVHSSGEKSNGLSRIVPLFSACFSYLSPKESTVVVSTDYQAMPRGYSSNRYRQHRTSPKQSRRRGILDGANVALGQDEFDFALLAGSLHLSSPRGHVLVFGVFLGHAALDRQRLDQRPHRSLWTAEPTPLPPPASGDAVSSRPTGNGDMFARGGLHLS